MALTPSNMPSLGKPAPAFSLCDPSGQQWSLDSFNDKKLLLVIFMCNHCPFVIHIRDTLAEFAKRYQAKGVAVVGINANDAEQYPEDNLDGMAKAIKEVGYTFPYLFDESQKVAKAYEAACTPDFFLFDEQRKLIYRGQFDDSRPGNNIPVTGQDLGHAIDQALLDKALSPEQKPSIGCNIKWK